MLRFSSRKKKKERKKEENWSKSWMWIYPTGSPRPFGPGLPDGPSGYGITGMNMYNALGGDFYSRVNQTGKDDLSLLSHCRLLSLYLQTITKMFPHDPPNPPMHSIIIYTISKHCSQTLISIYYHHHHHSLSLLMLLNQRNSGKIKKFWRFTFGSSFLCFALWMKTFM